MSQPLLERPADLFDRATEWQALSKFVTDPRPGLRVCIVYGRRRQGKSFLLRRLVAATKGFYHQALLHEPAQALAEWGRELGDYAGTGPVSFSNWVEAIEALARISPRQSAKGAVAKNSRPLVIAIDEFPFLSAKSPVLGSVIQRAVDQSVDRGWPPIKLILCGSSLSVMSGLLAGQGPLRGRVDSYLLLKPFDFRTAAEFWKISDPDLAFRVHSILGGTPGYRNFVQSVPTKLTEFNDWVFEEILNPAKMLFREDEWLLGEEPSLSDRGIYLSILSAAASGKLHQSSIAAELGREQRSVQHPLNALTRTGFLDKDEDQLRQRRPLYRISEPIMRFHQVIRNQDIARFEIRDNADVWADAQPRFESLVLGPHFEHLAREYIGRFAAMSSGKLADSQIASVGTAVLTDNAERASHEIDLVALGRGSGLRRKLVRAVGEAKLRELNSDDLNRLIRIQDRIGNLDDVSIKDSRLILASAKGFSESLTQAAKQRSDISLFSLKDFYED